MNRTLTEWHEIYERMRSNNVTDVFAFSAIQDLFEMETALADAEIAAAQAKDSEQAAVANLSAYMVQFGELQEQLDVMTATYSAMTAANQELKRELGAIVAVNQEVSSLETRLALAQSQEARLRAAYATCRATLEQLAVAGNESARSAIARSRTFLAADSLERSSSESDLGKSVVR